MRNLFSMLGGVALGAIVGILFAPYSGEETRAKIKAIVQEKMPNISKEKLEQVVDEVIEKVTGKEKQVEAD